MEPRTWEEFKDAQMAQDNVLRGKAEKVHSNAETEASEAILGVPSP